jgi:hypothetical protein
LDTPKRSHKVISLGEKVKVLDKERKYAKTAKFYNKNKFSICEIVKEKNFVLVLLSNFKLQKK